MSTVSIRKVYDSNTNSYTVVVTNDFGKGVKTTENHYVHTDPDGKGLYQDGKQIEGRSRFDAGKDAAGAIRRYYGK